ncbi:MAG: ABC transporter permease subunit, partial [Desulfuromonadaceae bacterium]
IHTLRPNRGAVSAIIPSPRDKTLFSGDSGEIHADHMTSERNLLTVKPAAPITHAALSPKGNTLTALDGTGTLTVWKMDIPHPEISFGTLFGKVWYEGYDKPEYSWQSSAANDDFEPKMSLVPLVFGTIKATFFAMLFAVPLALLGALYTSQFMSPKLKGRVKPVVEIMAAIPSVVIGFLAGLWLAPLIDKSILTVFLSLVIVPLMLLVTIFFWKRMKTASPLQRATRGHEFIAMVPVVILGVYLAFLLSGAAEVNLFAGDFKQWLFSTLGVRYDQRNSIIIAIALGFAVIPIIFTIAEDAISNVPRNLTAASLALGASRWQTAWRVVLPSALPGVFSAVMIGFGRAIGETMIVLMATGNTPIMSWSLFNGLRSLSANIAVEIPEAPLNSSLYRVLFLSAVLLFIFTFIINTVAEALRQRFRKKYGRY